MPSSSRKPSSEAGSALRAEAAAWVVARDRGFTTSETIAFERWLAVDPRHAAAIEEASGVWAVLNRIPSHVGQPVMEKSIRRVRWRWPVMTGVAAAALAFLVWSGGVGSATFKMQNEAQPTAEQSPVPIPH